MDRGRAGGADRAQRRAAVPLTSVADPDAVKSVTAMFILVQSKTDKFSDSPPVTAKEPKILGY